MTGALIILAVTVAIGVMLWAWEKFRSRRNGHSLHHHNNGQEPRVMDQGHDTDGPQATAQPTSICCGMHAICEKTGKINEPPVYYDDEELDRFAGRAECDYTEEETEEFRDVLLTLLPADAPGWSVSLEKRRIKLPESLKPELELMLSEV
ncbi:MAG: hypothetical protein K2H49_03065 [Muribaculaceae bacterium]|nr:hypothetical protein [Muribaculaceae bacterium]